MQVELDARLVELLKQLAQLQSREIDDIYLMILRMKCVVEQKGLCGRLAHQKLWILSKSINQMILNLDFESVQKIV